MSSGILSTGSCIMLGLIRLFVAPESKRAAMFLFTMTISTRGSGCVFPSVWLELQVAPSVAGRRVRGEPFLTQRSGFPDSFR